MLVTAPLTVILNLSNKALPDSIETSIPLILGGILTFRDTIAIDGIVKWGSNADIRSIKLFEP